MSRMSKLVTGALAAVVADILVNVIAASIHVPRKYFLLVPLSLLALVILTVALNLDFQDGRTVLSHRKSAASRHADNPKSPESSGETEAISHKPEAISHRTKAVSRKPEIIKGKRMARWEIEALCWAGLFHDINVATLFYVMTLVALGLITCGISFIVWTTQIAIGLITMAIGLSLITLLIWINTGIRIRLILSGEGIRLIDARGKHFIRWGEAANFRIMTVGRFLSNAYLVADPLQEAWQFEKKWKYDSKRKVIRLCNLSASGIDSRMVSTALENWDPQSAAKKEHD